MSLYVNMLDIIGNTLIKQAFHLANLQSSRSGASPETAARIRDLAKTVGGSP